MTVVFRQNQMLSSRLDGRLYGGGMSVLKDDSGSIAMRTLLEVMFARLAALTGVSAQLKMARAVARFTRLLIDYERDVIAKARRAEVLACPALRRAAFLAIGLRAILRWEAAWLRRQQPVKSRKPYEARPAISSKPVRQTGKASDARYALMPLPKRDYGPRNSQSGGSGITRESGASRYKTLPPAYVYPHEICDRPPMSARDPVRTSSSHVEGFDSADNHEESQASRDKLRPSIRAGPES